MALPNIKQLWPLYPQGEKSDVATLVGGDVQTHIVKDDWDTCCIRLSRVLNYSGSPVTGWAQMANPYMAPNSKVRASKGGDGKWYIYSTFDLRVYLTAKFGRPKHFKSKEEAVKGVAGIIMFGWAHVDLWDGSTVCHLALFDHASSVTNGVFIWPTPA